MTESAHEVSLLAARHHDAHIPLSTGGIAIDDAGRQKRSQALEAFKDVIAGSSAGMVGKVIEYPFDTVKVRLQSSTRYKGPLDCFTQSIRNEGVAGLYRGISAPLLGAAIETSSLFFSYRLAQETFQNTLYRDKSRGEPLPLPVLMACGALSGIVTSTLLTPIELVKCQMQIPNDSYRGDGVVTSGGNASNSGNKVMVQRNPLTVIASVYRHNGFSGFWHGHLGTLIRETGGGAAWFGIYEGVTAFFRRYRHSRQITSDVFGSADRPISSSRVAPLPIWQHMVAGASAGVSYNFLFYPADTVKSRMQTEEVGGGRKSSNSGSTGSSNSSSSNVSRQPSEVRKLNFWSVGKALWREQGIKGMYRGCGITVARSAPSSAFIFTVNESLRNWIG